MATPSAQFSLYHQINFIPSGFNREVSRAAARAVAEEAERAGSVREQTTDTAERSIP